MDNAACARLLGQEPAAVYCDLCIGDPVFRAPGMVGQEVCGSHWQGLEAPQLPDLVLDFAGSHCLATDLGSRLRNGNVDLRYSDHGSLLFCHRQEPWLGLGCGHPDWHRRVGAAGCHYFDRTGRIGSAAGSREYGLEIEGPRQGSFSHGHSRGWLPGMEPGHERGDLPEHLLCQAG